MEDKSILQVPFKLTALLTICAAEKRLAMFFRTTVARLCISSLITDSRPSLQRTTMATMIARRIRNAID